MLGTITHAASYVLTSVFVVNLYKRDNSTNGMREKCCDFHIEESSVRFSLQIGKYVLNIFVKVK